MTRCCAQRGGCDDRSSAIGHFRAGQPLLPDLRIVVEFGVVPSETEEFGGRGHDGERYLRVSELPPRASESPQWPPSGTLSRTGEGRGRVHLLGILRTTPQGGTRVAPWLIRPIGDSLRIIPAGLEGPPKSGKSSTTPNCGKAERSAGRSNYGFSPKCARPTGGVPIIAGFGAMPLNSSCRNPWMPTSSSPTWLCS